MTRKQELLKREVALMKQFRKISEPSIEELRAELSEIKGELREIREREETERHAKFLKTLDEKTIKVMELFDGFFQEYTYKEDFWVTSGWESFASDVDKIIRGQQ